MYENNFTRVNPGLLVLLVDQSKSTSVPWDDTMSIADKIALSCNLLIAEAAGRFCCGTKIKNSICVVVLGYGGDEHDEVYTIRRGLIGDLFEDKSIPTQLIKRHILDGAGGYVDFDIALKKFVNPCSYGLTYMGCAFQMAYDIVTEWVNRSTEILNANNNIIGERDILADPVPWVINISDGDIDNGQEVLVQEYVQKLSDIKCPDGNPLICNVVFKGPYFPQEEFPSTIENSDCNLLFVNSSDIPIEYTHIYEQNKNGTQMRKLYIQNPSNIACIAQFFRFGGVASRHS